MDKIALTGIVRAYGSRANFPAEGIASLTQGAVALPEEAIAVLNADLNDYRTSEKITYAMQEAFEKASSPVHCYTAQMLYYMAFLPVLEEKYREKKLSEAFFDRVLFDLRAKLLECRDVYDIWGSFVAIWFARFFNFTLYVVFCVLLNWWRGDFRKICF